MNKAQAKAFRKLIDQLDRKHAKAQPDDEPSLVAPDPGLDSCPDEADPVVHQLVYSMLLWEASHKLAAAGIAALREQFVDHNDLRVCHADEVAAMLGQRYPRVQERCDRLRAALCEVYDRENAMSLDRLHEVNKRDSFAYFESLEGVPRFVAARVALLTSDTHVFPIDERLAACLNGAKACEPGVEPDELAGRIERELRAGEANNAYRLIELWAERARSKRSAQPPSPKRPCSTRARTRRNPKKNPD